MRYATAVSSDFLRIDARRETARIVAGIRDIVLGQLKRKGVVVGVSGGIDSSLVAYLCARSLGSDHVLAVLTPEAESPPESLRLGRLVAESLGVRCAVEDISPVLAAAQCYQRRDSALRNAVPEYRTGWTCKIVLPSIHEPEDYALFSVIVQSPEGKARWVPLPAEDYLSVVAASSLKQRVRKMVEYYHADLLQYAVAGTPNRLEYDQGFFVKSGDGAADFKPIAHLYKSQVHQLAEHLGVPEEIRLRPSSTGMYPLEQPREDFYFMLPVDKMDLCLYGKNNGISAADLAAVVDLDDAQVQRVYEAIAAKRAAAQYLRAAPLLVNELSELEGSACD